MTDDGIVTGADGGGTDGQAPEEHGQGEPVVVFITGPDRETVSQLACSLVNERLAACANLLDGVTSVFRWKGAVHEESEVLAILKTTADRLPELDDRVRELHPYEVPEVIALPLTFGSAPYLAWVRDSVS